MPTPATPAANPGPGGGGGGGFVEHALILTCIGIVVTGVLSLLKGQAEKAVSGLKDAADSKEASQGRAGG